MTTRFDVNKVKVDMSLFNETQRFAQQIKQIEPILNSSCNRGLSEVALCSIKKILEAKKEDASRRMRKQCRQQVS